MSSSLAGHILAILVHKGISAVGREYDILDDFPRQIESLQDELRRMQCFLKDADVNQSHIHSRVRTLAHDAENLIDNFEMDRESIPQSKNLICYKCKQWRDKRRITREIKSIKHALWEINQSARSSDMNPNPQDVVQQQEDPSQIVGLEEEADKLIGQLRWGEDNRRSVISIVGMGGIGKSTLARKVYEHDAIKKHFKLRAWVWISQSFEDYRGVLITILLSIGKVAEDELRSLRTERLEGFFYESLKAKRYLVVLDDVWGPPRHPPWDRLLQAFPDGQNRSRILLTTRMNDVAVSADPRSIPLQMNHLGEVQSWKLFSNKASISPDDIEFRDIGRKIVARCGGLPLSISVMGSKLVGKRRADWVEEHKKMEDNPLQEEVLKQLELSYNALTPELKYCFLRLGFFPGNCPISTRKLIEIWIAEGLITVPEGQRAEAIAESHIDMLAEKSIIETLEINPDGRIKTCRIDNSLRELCIWKAKQEIILEIQENAEFQPSSQCRHLAVHCSSMDRYFDSQLSCHHLRSLLFLVPDSRISSAQLELNCKRFKLLKVLHLEGMIVESLPDDVGELRNLRYLNLRNTKIDQLCQSMRNLKKLLILDIRDNMYLIDLSVVGYMTNLRTLYLPGSYEKLKLDSLRELQTLKRVKVFGPESLVSLENLIVLRTLQVHLGGPLNLESFLNSVKKLKQLESLHLYPDTEISSLVTRQFSSLASLTKLYIKGGVRELPRHEDFPPNLVQLTLDGSGLTPFPLEDLVKLPKLSILRLRNLYIKGEKLSFSVDGIPRLKYLELADLWNLKELEIHTIKNKIAYWSYMISDELEIQGRHALSRLERLKISNCTALKGLPGEIEHITSLSELQMDRMREGFVMKFQKEFRYKLQHVRSIKFTNTLKSHEEI